MLSESWEKDFFQKFSSPRRKFCTVCNTKTMKISDFSTFSACNFSLSQFFFKFWFLVNIIDKKCFFVFESFHLQGEKSLLFVTQKSWKFPFFRLFKLATFHFFKTFYNFCFWWIELTKSAFWDLGTWFFRKFSSPRRKFGTACNTHKTWKFPIFRLF